MTKTIKKHTIKKKTLGKKFTQILYHINDILLILIIPQLNKTYLHISMLININTEENCILHAYKTFNMNKSTYLNFD